MMHYIPLRTIIRDLSRGWAAESGVRSTKRLVEPFRKREEPTNPVIPTPVWGTPGKNTGKSGDGYFLCCYFFFLIFTIFIIVITITFFFVFIRSNQLIRYQIRWFWYFIIIIRSKEKQNRWFLYFINQRTFSQ